MTFRPLLITGQQAPGFEDGTLIQSFGGTLLEVNGAGRFTVSVTLSDATNVLFSEQEDGTLTPIAQTQRQAPGVLEGVNLTSFTGSWLEMNESGQAAFSAHLVGSGVTSANNRAVFSNVHGTVTVVAREGDPIPGLAGYTVGDILGTADYLELSNGGDTVFWVHARGPGITEQAILSYGGGMGLRSVAFSTGPVPGFPDGTAYRGFFGNTVSVDDSGRVAFLGSILGDEVFEHYVLFREDQNFVPQALVREGFDAPGLPAGATIDNIDPCSPRMNASGECAFVGIARGVPPADAQAIFTIDSQSNLVSIAVRYGDQVPGLPDGFHFYSLSDPRPNSFMLNDAGDLYFYARIDGPGVDLTNRYAWFVKTRGQDPVLVARQGEQVPGLPEGYVFTTSAYLAEFNDQGQLALIANATNGVDTIKSLFLTDSNDTLMRVVSEGDTIDIDPDATGVDDRTVTSLGALKLADSGKVILIASFGVGVQGMLAVDVPSPCPPDTNNDGTLSPADFSAWISAFNAQSPACDQNNDTLCTSADFSAWIANYNAGCG